MSRSTIVGVVLACTASVASAASDGASPVGPGSGDGTSAVVGGSDVPEGKWPDTVAVLGKRGICSGTLIAPDVVLTAGHCADIEPVSVVANTIDYAGNSGTKVNVARTVAYPDWENSYDVSVIVLGTPINAVTPRRIGTACSFDAFAPSTPVRLVGFGATDMQGATTNTHLKEAMTAVVDPTCADGHGCNPSVAPGGEFVAGGTGNADSCFGDSGGPVYLDTPRGAILVGAVSRGVSGAATPCGGGGIYVRTDKIIPWIEETTGRTVAKDECTAETYSTGAPDDTGDGADASTGGCSTSGGSSSLVFGLLALGFAVSRRR